MGAYKCLFVIPEVLIGYPENNKRMDSHLRSVGMTDSIVIWILFVICALEFDILWRKTTMPILNVSSLLINTTLDI